LFLFGFFGFFWFSFLYLGFPRIREQSGDPEDQSCPETNTRLRTMFRHVVSGFYACIIYVCSITQKADFICLNHKVIQPTNSEASNPKSALKHLEVCFGTSL